MEIIEISLKEFERLKNLGIEVNTIRGQTLLIIDGIILTKSVSNEDLSTELFETYESQQNVQTIN